MGEFQFVKIISFNLKMSSSSHNIESLSHTLLFFLQEIPPFETKGVMRASFSSRDVDNHTAYIRIKTNAPNEDQFIILPVEVEVTSGVLPVANRLFIFWTRLKILLDCNQDIGPNLVFFSNPVFFPVNLFGCFAAPGIYSSTEMLDFGTLRSQGIKY